ncbi:hypothetical protein [Thalassotalea piscium]|uniref:DUF3108 domain-containing protein n=1 Tax=Thalassotalea piscium TaxID=1230533 RepID=A0A7X0NJW0_9GAMM|nr:hypothetical protein [Thalassotalea piscium]MBB6544788.1 hypothetical protein [Thalassotalea piscium]
MIKYFGVIFMLCSMSVHATTLLGEVLESNYDFGKEPKNNYLIKVKEVFDGDYPWQYEVITIKGLVSTKPIEKGHFLLVEKGENEDYFMGVFGNDYTLFGFEKTIQFVFAKDLERTLNQQNTKHEFIRNGRLDFSIENVGGKAKLTYGDMYFNIEPAVTTDYYINEMANKMLTYLRSVGRVSFQITVKDFHITVKPWRDFGNTYTLEVAVKKYDLKGDER